MVIHKYSHVVQNIFSMTVCVYPSFSVQCMRFNFDTDWFNNNKWVKVTVQVRTTYF